MKLDQVVERNISSSELTGVRRIRMLTMMMLTILPLFFFFSNRNLHASPEFFCSLCRLLSLTMINRKEGRTEEEGRNRME